MKRTTFYALSIAVFGACMTSCTKSLVNALSSSLGNNNNPTTGNVNYTGAPGTVSTLAGNGIQGFQDGAANNAEFFYPTALTVDASGNVYVVDATAFAIRKITPSGVVSTLAGNGTQGYVDGPGPSARFEAPNGIAVDKLGNLYVTEGTAEGNNRIRMIATDGTVSTIAGNGNYGYVNGAAPQAEFYVPMGIAANAQNNLYITDVDNQCIRKIVGLGLVSIVTTLAGNGTQGYMDGQGTVAEFNIPAALAFDPSGNLYVADEQNFCIREITAAGVVSTFVGNPNNSGFNNGTGANAQFSNPLAIASDASGNLYVAEGGINNCIRKITPNGVVTTYAGNQDGNFEDGPFAKAYFFYPEGVAVDSKGNVYVADTENYRIRKITPQ